MCVRACMGLFGSFPLFPFFGASRGGGETLGKISEQAGQGKEGKREKRKRERTAWWVEDQKYFFGRDDGKSRQGRDRLFGSILPFSLLGICVWSFSRRGEGAQSDPTL